MIDWARTLGHGRLLATVWDWNRASIRVLEKVGFTDSGRRESSPYGVTVVMRKDL